MGVRPEYGLIGPAIFSHSPHHPKSDAAGNPVRAMMRDRRCDRIGRPSRTSSLVLVARARVKTQPQITPSPYNPTKQLFYSPANLDVKRKIKKARGEPFGISELGQRNPRFPVKTARGFPGVEFLSPYRRPMGLQEIFHLPSKLEKRG